MTNAEHIISWAENDRTHYDRLRLFEAQRAAMIQVAAAHTAYCIAESAYLKGRKAGDIVEPYSAADILDAAKLVAVWSVEG